MKVTGIILFAWDTFRYRDERAVLLGAFLGLCIILLYFRIIKNL